jgi:hypothetical protein
MAFTNILLKLAKWTGLCLVAVVIALYFVWVYLDYRIRQESQMIPQEDCPILAWLHPIDRIPIKPDDYIELRSWSAGPYSGEPIHIRIFADGRLERDTVEIVDGNTDGCPMEEGDKIKLISAKVATALIASARDGGFCRLCRSYHQPGFVFDGGGATVTLSLNKKVKTVSYSNIPPPPLVGELEGRIGLISPMSEFANPQKFSPARAAKCEAFMEAQEEKRKARKNPNGP